MTDRNYYLNCVADSIESIYRDKYKRTLDRTERTILKRAIMKFGKSSADDAMRFAIDFYDEMPISIMKNFMLFCKVRR